MRYRPKSVAALDIALGSLPNRMRMRVEVDRGIAVSARTVGELRKVTAWPENLAIVKGTAVVPAQRSLFILSTLFFDEG